MDLHPYDTERHDITRRDTMKNQAWTPSLVCLVPNLL
jgi:hypothetical protein